MSAARSRAGKCAVGGYAHVGPTFGRPLQIGFTSKQAQATLSTFTLYLLSIGIGRMAPPVPSLQADSVYLKFTGICGGPLTATSGTL